LKSDPYFVCFAGQHALAGGLAALVLVAYVVLLHLITLLWLWRSPELTRTQQLQQQPVVLHQAEAIEASVKDEAAHSGLPAADPILSPFLGDSGYAIRFWWWRHADLIAMLILAANQAAQPRPNAVPLIVSCISCCVHHASWWPPPLHTSRRPCSRQVVKAGIICLVVLPLCVMVFVRGGSAIRSWS